MNIFEKKDGLLFDVLSILDKCTRDFIIVSKDKTGNIKYGLHKKYFGTWVLISIILIYISSLFFYLFLDKFIVDIIVIVTSVIFIIFMINENKIKYKTDDEVVIKNIYNNSYDNFYENVKVYSTEKLIFLMEYIEHLLSRYNKNNNINYVTVLFIPILVKVISNNVGKTGDKLFIFYLIFSLLICFVSVIIYNMLPKTLYFEKNKLIKLKNYLEYVSILRKTKEKL